MPRKNWTTEIILGVLILIAIVAIIAVSIGGGDEQASAAWVIQSEGIHAVTFN